MPVVALKSSEPAVLSSDLFEAALAHLPHGLCMFDANTRLILCNQAYAAMYDLPACLTRPGTHLDEILAHRSATGNAPANLDTYYDVIPIAHRSGRHAGTRIKLVDGRTVQITHNPMANGGYVALHEDVTTLVDSEERLRHLAGHDQLTGLYNRRAFAECFASALDAAKPGSAVAVHCLDLDRFKAVNDALGHHAGDMLLRHVAARIVRCVAPDDVVGRLGGDEFIILQPAVERQKVAEKLGRKVVDAITRPFDLNGHRVRVGVSVGIAMRPRHGATSDMLMRNADQALYEAKSSGGNAYRFADRAYVSDAALAPGRCTTNVF